MPCWRSRTASTKKFGSGWRLAAGPACLSFFLYCWLYRGFVDQATTGFEELATLAQIFKHGVENSIDKLPAFFCAEGFGNFDRFVDANLRRDVRKVEKLTDAHSEQQRINHRDTVELPVCGLRSND